MLRHPDPSSSPRGQTRSRIAQALAANEGEGRTAARQILGLPTEDGKEGASQRPIQIRIDASVRPDEWDHETESPLGFGRRVHRADPWQCLRADARE
ncbi:hypothetical protein GCM10025768_07870 [Microbacterium pseudoresistens]